MKATFESLTDLPLARRWREQPYPVASVLALIRRDGAPNGEQTAPQFLLIQRNTEPYIGKWGLVGGRWEFGETLEAAVTREVKEETGLDTAFIALRGMVSERIAPSSAKDDGAHYLLFVCALAADGGQAEEQSEGAVAWFSRHEIEALNEGKAIIASDYAILARFGDMEAALPYVEADVVAGKGAEGTQHLVRFDPR